MTKFIRTRSKPYPRADIKGKCLHLGCGPIVLKSSKVQEWVNLDVMDFDHVDVAWDLDKYPYPFKENSFDYIYGRCIAEHVQFLDKFIEELHRILKPNGILDLTLPYETGVGGAAAHYQHKRAANANRFGGSEHMYKLEFVRLIFGKGWNIWNHALEPIFNKMIYVYDNTLLRYLFPAYNIQFILRKK